MTSLKRLAFAALWFLGLVGAQVAEDQGLGDGRCTHELVHSYRLYPAKDDTLHDPFYLCPHVEHDCCSFDSQKMIQILWIRISQPRLQRLLTHHLGSLEFISNSIKAILNVFGKTKLPASKKYSAECLQTIDDMQQLIDMDLAAVLDRKFEEVKIAYNNLYKFKRQFYCDICNRDSHPFFNLVNKRVDFSIGFCQKFSADYVPIAHFLNFDLIRYFTMIKNYVQCYSSKNYLFLPSLDDFKVPSEDRLAIENCREKLVCAPFCQRYSITDLPDIFVGNKENFDRMVFFLKHHKPDSRGYFISEPDYVQHYNEMLLQEHLENLRDNNKPVNSDEESKLNAKIYFEQQNLKRDFTPGKASEIEAAMMELYKNSFEFFRTKFVRNKMSQIKKRVAEEYNDRQMRQNFLNINDAAINLEEYRTRLMPHGLDPYLNLDKEKMYTTNANLTLFTKEISNTVADLLYLNETKIMDQIVDTGKLMQTDADAKEAVSSFIKSKIFDKESDSHTFIIENPYIDTHLSAGRFAGWLAAVLAVWTALN